ncbi:hypothetical protein F4703DRAFT_1789187 [Phycomyces blakesleeanus]
MTHEFPAELFFIIASHLTRSDYINCSKVCKSWRKPFYQLIWQTVVINHRRKAIYTQKVSNGINGLMYIKDTIPIYEVIEMSSIMLPNYRTNGAFTRKLKLGPLILASNAEITEIQKYFVNVNILFLYPLSVSPSVFMKKVYWTAWRNLSYLNTDIPYIYGTRKAQTILNIAFCIPTLNVLVIRNIDYETSDYFSVDDLEKLHHLLPNLTALRIKFSIAPVTVEEFERIACPSPAKMMVELDICYELTDFSLLYYCALKYPKLEIFSYKALSFRIRPPPTLFENIEGPFERPVRDLMNISVQYQGHILNKLRRLPPFFQNLKSIVLKDRPTSQWQSHMIWEFIMKFHVRITKAEYRVKGLRFKTSRGNPSMPMEMCLNACSDSVQRLCLTCCFIPYGPSIQIRRFDHFPCLVSLIIKLNYRVEIEVDYILHGCPVLELLLVDGDVLIISTENYNNIEHNLEEQKDISLLNERIYPRSHGLKHLLLGRLSIMAYILYYISCTCRNLETLEFHWVMIYGLMSQTKELEINMPYTSLKKLVIDYVNFERMHKGYRKQSYSSPHKINYFMIDTIDNRGPDSNGKKQRYERQKPVSVTGFNSSSWIYRPVFFETYPSGGRMWKVCLFYVLIESINFPQETANTRADDARPSLEIRHTIGFSENNHTNTLLSDKRYRQYCASFLFKVVEEYCVNMPVSE